MTLLPSSSDSEISGLMHPCLQIEEILRCIFEFVYGDRHIKCHPKRRSLANLAISCRTFLRPALETLWFHLPSLGPLVMCLPEDAWVVRRNDRNLPKLVCFSMFLIVVARWTDPTLVPQTDTCHNRLGTTPIICAFREVLLSVI